MFRRPPLHYPERPLHHFLQDAADRHPEKIALRFEDDVYTYRELDSTGNSFANALLALGFGPGTRWRSRSPTGPSGSSPSTASAWPGARSCSRTPRGRRRSSSTRSRSTEPDVIVADAALAEVLDAAGAPGTRICVDADAPPGWLSFWDLVFGTPGQRPAPLPESALDADYAYPFSSGTTGLPKAVRHTHRSLVAAVINWNSACAVREEDHVQFFLPLFHIYGIAIHGLHVGVGRDHHAVPALRPRRDAVAHRARPASRWRSGRRPSRWRWPTTPSWRSTTSRHFAT